MHFREATDTFGTGPGCYEVWTGNLKNRSKCLMGWEPYGRSIFFFGPPAHLCAITSLNEILSTVA